MGYSPRPFMHTRACCWAMDTVGLLATERWPRRIVPPWPEHVIGQRNYTPIGSRPGYRGEVDPSPAHHDRHGLGQRGIVAQGVTVDEEQVGVVAGGEPAFAGAKTAFLCRDGGG
jgi:hypothetical protein